MNEHIRQILQDLYAIDPQFQKHEAKLVQIISELLTSKPDITIDAAFAQQLRTRLQARAHEIEESRNHTYTQQTVRRLSWFTYAFATFGLVALLASGTIYYQAQRPGIKTAQEVISLLSKDTQVKSVAPGSFGSLSTVTLTNAGGKGGDNSMENAGVQADIGNAGSGGGNAATPTVAPDAKMIAPDWQPINYKFVYKGEGFTVPSGEMDVLQRVKELNSGASSSILEKISFGLVNINKFNNTVVDSLVLAEDRDFGYQVSANFREGSVSIYQNWTKWPQPGADCRDEACYQRIYESTLLKPEDVPADNVIIDIANQFLGDYGINRSQYGNPMVQDFWKQDLARAQSSTLPYPLYIPEVINVIYPLQINDQTVFDENGYPAGLMVNVNIRQNKVTDVYDIRSQSYNASAYGTETDTKRLIGLAERGGFRSYMGFYQDPNAKTEIIELGTPTISYARVWKYDAMNSQELFVPALVFPITKNSSTQPYYQKNIVIPLVKEILDAEPEPPVAVPLPMSAETPVAKPVDPAR